MHDKPTKALGLRGGAERFLLAAASAMGLLLLGNTVTVSNLESSVSLSRVNLKAERKRRKFETRTADHKACRGVF